MQTKSHLDSSGCSGNRSCNVNRIEKESQGISKKLRVWGLFSSLCLCLLKGIIGVLGRSEALVADGLYSLYLVYVCGTSISHGDALQHEDEVEIPRSHLAPLLIGFVLVVGVLDVMTFSVVRLTVSNQGILTIPSPYALVVAALSVLINLFLAKRCRAVEEQSSETALSRMRQGFDLSARISILVFAGVAISWVFWPAGDALAALICACIMVKPVAEIFLEWRRGYSTRREFRMKLGERV